MTWEWTQQITLLHISSALESALLVTAVQAKMKLACNAS